jgi:hypothetical protein
MNKKLVFIGFLVLVGIGIGIWLIIGRPGPSSKMLSPLIKEKSAEEEIEFEWTEWQDPAGFSFEYPENFQVDSHQEDETNYAFLELTWEGKKGRLIILCNDADYGTIDEWLEKDELVAGASSLETTIASVSGRKVALGEGREMAAFIDQDQVIYLIDKQSEGEAFWHQVYSRVLSSFKLIPLEDETQADFENWLKGFDTSDVDVVESLEVIE